MKLHSKKKKSIKSQKLILNFPIFLQFLGLSFKIRINQYVDNQKKNHMTHKEIKLTHNYIIFNFLKLKRSKNLTVKKNRKMLEPSNQLNENKDSLFPGFTEWKESKLCCFRIFLIPKLHQHFCGHWEISPLYPALFFLLSFSSILLLTIYVLPFFGKEGCVMIVFITILFILFIVSYCRIIIDGPGYYPFYWGTQYQPQDAGIDSYLYSNSDDSPAGIISNERQLEWCKKREIKPPRSMLSLTARRFVLRPEHYCKWASSWIGKRNHKFFMLFTFYGILYLALFVVYLARRVVQYFSEDFSFSILLLTIYGVCAAAFCLLLITFFVSNMIDISLNRTFWEQWNGIDYTIFNQGIIKNFEDVFGSSRYFWCWICPFSPWRHKSNDDLSSAYPSYQTVIDDNQNYPMET